MIESAFMKVCIVDWMAPAHSKVYKKVRRMCGKRVADLLVDEVEVRFKPPDEVNHAKTTGNNPNPVGIAG